jgi:hypothetical protein
MAVPVSMIGKIAALFQEHEYALIVSDAGDNVVAHADTFGDHWRNLVPGVAVRFSSLQGTLALKAYNVTLLTSEPTNTTAPTRAT